MAWLLQKNIFFFLIRKIVPKLQMTWVLDLELLLNFLRSLYQHYSPVEGAAAVLEERHPAWPFLFGLVSFQCIYKLKKSGDYED